MCCQAMAALFASPHRDAPSRNADIAGAGHRGLWRSGHLDGSVNVDG